MDLADMSLSDNPASPRLFVFAAGATWATANTLCSTAERTAPARPII